MQRGVHQCWAAWAGALHEGGDHREEVRTAVRRMGEVHRKAERGQKAGARTVRAEAAACAAMLLHRSPVAAAAPDQAAAARSYLRAAARRAPLPAAALGELARPRRASAAPGLAAVTAAAALRREGRPPVLHSDISAGTNLKY